MNRLHGRPFVAQASRLRLFLAGLLVGWMGAAGVAPAGEGPAGGDARGSPGEQAKQFVALMDRVGKGAGAAEADAQQLLELAKVVGRPHAAYQAVRAYLERTLNPGRGLVLAAAENAFLAGQYQAAIGRYKTYLQTAEPNAEASRAAAMLYVLLLDFKNDADDAYQFMRLHGAQFRLDAAARKFDGWFLDEAFRRRDLTAHAQRLALIFGEKRPLEEERWQYWGELDRLLNELTRTGKEQLEAARAAGELAGLIRENPRRAARAAFLAQHLAFKAATAGKPEAEQTQAFAAVTAAALVYVDSSPVAVTLQDILSTFAGGGGGFNGGEWRAQEPLKRQFFAAAVGKLPEAEQKALARWRPDNRFPAQCASPEQWAALATRAPGLFQDAEFAREFELAEPPQTLEVAQKLALALKDVPSRQGARMRALAAGGADFAACAQALVLQESWHLDFPDVYRILSRDLWPAFKAFPRAEKDKLPDNYWDKFLVAFGAEHIAKSPLALFDPEAAREYLLAAWRMAGDAPADKAANFVPHLQAVAWLPAGEPNREGARDAALAAVQGEFQNWAAKYRKGGKGRDKDKSISDAELTAFAKVDAAFKALAQDKNGDPSKAPDALCQKLCACLLGLRGKFHTEFVKAARETYPLVRDVGVKKTPFGQAAINFLVRGRERMDTFDLQTEILADQLAQASLPAIGTRAQELKDAISDQGTWHDLGRILPGERDRARRLNGIFGQALLRLAEGGERFSPSLFYAFRVTRRGEKWSDQELGSDVMEKLLEKRTLLSAGWSPDWRVRSGTGAYMWLISQEFPGLQAKYPPASFFDDLFIEEARATGQLDGYYWALGLDVKGKVARAAAELLTQRDGVSLGFDGQKAVCRSREEYLAWVDRIAGSGVAEVRDPFVAKAESLYGKTRFDSVAMGRVYFNVHAELQTPEGRKEFFTRLGQYLERSRASLDRVPLPYLAKLSYFEESPKAALTTAEADVLTGVFPDATPARWPGGYGYDVLARVLYRGLRAGAGAGELFALIPQFWRIARDTRDQGLRDQLGAWAREHFEKKEMELALAHAQAGLFCVGAGLPAEMQATFTSIRTQALGSAGVPVAVDRSHPNYALYAAQAAYAGGNYQGALDLAAPQLERLADRDRIKDFDPAFSLWLIARETEAMEYDTAEKLGRAMKGWLDTRGAASDPELRARVDLVFANIAFGRRSFPLARAHYERIAVAKEYEGTRAALEAEIQIAEVERLTRQYDQALARLEKLSHRKERYLQTESLYHLALVKYDQEDWPEAQKLLEQLFTFEPNHAEGRILEGNVLLKLKKLEQATLVKLGVTASQSLVVPGKPLRVSLEDRNLAIVGKSSNIEIHAWTDGGDDETFLLLPFGDSKTRFQGQLPTAMNPVAKHDGTLQVLGGEKIHYDFSDAFRQAHHLTGSPPGTLNVATDAELYASSGKILTRKEAEEAALERMLLEKLQLDESRSRRDTTTGRDIALSTVRPQDQVKPGNPINLRVVDLDRNVTHNKDQVTVRVAASSGDVVRAFPLTETEGDSGVFEGSVPTASAEATAFASDSAEGSQPNFAISGGATYPAWLGQPDNVRPKVFSVDLKDNVALGPLHLDAKEPNRKLKSFTLQTSLNGRDFLTVGRWPEAFKPWDGTLEAEVVRYDGKTTLGSLEDICSYLQFGAIARNAPRELARPKGLALSSDKDVADAVGRLRLDGDQTLIVHLYGAFAVAKRQVLTFQLDAKGRGRTAAGFLTVDGVLDREKGGVTRVFPKGVYRLDAYVVTTRSAGAGLDLLSDLQDPPNLTVCPREIFDLEKHPEIKPYASQATATITPSGDRSAFDIAFTPEARARMFRFILQDFESDAPALNRISLANAEGKAVLPCAADLLKLRENQVLEIVPGDRITVTYEDPVVLTAERRVHEVGLRATFTNATLSACFVDYAEPDANGERRAHYYPMWRFKPGEKINVFIHDPDGDVSEKADQLTFMAKATHGQPVEVAAEETAPHSGVFIGALFPVKAAPQRKSEVQVQEGDEVILSYFDKENTDPGIPWTRTVAVEQAFYQDPELRLYDVTAQPLAEAGPKKGAEPKTPKGAKPPRAAARPVKTEAESAASLAGEEAVPATRTMVVTRPTAVAGEKPAHVLMEGSLIVEVQWPTLALSPESKAELFVQTSSGRKKAQALATPFDLKVPGTLRVMATPGGTPRLTPPPGFRDFLIRTDATAKVGATAQDEGRFTFVVPLILAPLPEESLVGEPAGKDAKVGGRSAAGGAAAEASGLAIRGDDELFTGFKYADAQGQTRWLLGRAVLDSEAQLDVMERRYEQTVESAYVGETVYFRVIHRAMDRTDEKDRLKLELAASSGAKKTVELVETFEHAGIFKGFIRLAHAQDPEGAAGAGNFPVQYGDTLTVSYAGGGALTRTVFVHKGSDGTLVPFTKQYKDSGMGVQTQFTIAEAYFELAKKHRTLKEESLARRELAQGKKLLEEALRGNPDAVLRAQGEYLLANLTFEFAQLTDNEDLKKQGYQESLARFNDLVGSYPDSPYAAKSQFKKALCLEKMGQMDQACEEYVKLSYRYPDNELVAETIARLGQYFMLKGKDFTDQAKAKADEAKAEADAEKVKAAKLESEKLNLRARETYRTAGQVFSRLAPRFPTHLLAARTLVLAGQCFIYAQEMEQAIDALKRAAEDPNAEKESVAEALYWCGHAYMETADLPNAYRAFKKVTWDYPASKWSRYAANRLSDPKLATVKE